MTSIALVVLDTLRKDHFDEHFDWLPGVRYENAYSPSHWTVPVHASMFTGRYASELGVYANSEKLDCPETVLAESLSENGYTTRAFSANGNISDYFKFDRGFDDFRVNWRAEGWKEELEFKDAANVFDWKNFNAETDYNYPLRPIVGTLKCIFGEYDTLPSLKHGFNRKMRGPGSPKLSEDPKDYGSKEALEYVRGTEFGDDEFLFINLMDAHNPYQPPEEYRTVEPVRIHGLKATVEGPKVDDEHVRQAYDDSVRYLSDMYEKIFNEIRDDFDYIITLSDHGELLGEHDSWEHLCGIYPELTHIPLSVYSDNLQDCVRDEMVNLLDIHTTVLETAGIDTSKIGHESRGRNFLDDFQPRETPTEFHGLSRLHIQSLDDEWLEKVSYMDVELEGLVAPPTYYGYETFEGFVEDGEASLEDALARLEELVGELEKRDMRQEEYDDMSDDVMDRLEDLGYA
ncbi:MAG: sulfatase-like hydrolase/transferase [Halobacteria archaeon]|nr:sulfatase-like hydrolase/transferase [Halobacteria archaeon]